MYLYAVIELWVNKYASLFFSAETRPTDITAPAATLEKSILITYKINQLVCSPLTASRAHQVLTAAPTGSRSDNQRQRANGISKSSAGRWHSTSNRRFPPKFNQKPKKPNKNNRHSTMAVTHYLLCRSKLENRLSRFASCV